MKLEEALKILLAIFKLKQIRFAVAGAYAVSAWGVVRATRDMDLLIEMPGHNIQELANLLEEHFEVEMRRGNFEDPLVGVMKLTYNGKQGQEFIDLILGIKKLPQSIFDRVEYLMIGKWKLPVLSPEDLILTKLIAGSPLDLQDAQCIADNLQDNLDKAYLENMCKKLRLNISLLHFLQGK